MEEAVLRWVSRDPAGYGYLLDFYRRGARVCQAGEDGLVLKNDEIDLCYAGGSAFAPELLSCSLSLVEDPAADLMLTGQLKKGGTLKVLAQGDQVQVRLV